MASKKCWRLENGDAVRMAGASQDGHLVKMFPSNKWYQPVLSMSVSMSGMVVRAHRKTSQTHSLMIDENWVEPQSRI